MKNNEQPTLFLLICLIISSALVFVFILNFTVSTEAASSNSNCIGLKGANLANCQRDKYSSDLQNKYFSKIKKPDWDRNKFDCNNVPPEAGVVPISELKTYHCSGLISNKPKNNVTTIPQMQKPLCEAAKEAVKNNCKIYVKDSYRDFKTQVRLWCKDFNYITSTDERVGYVAVPGFSEHGRGMAVDVALLCQNKKNKKIYDDVTTIGPDKQCKVLDARVKELANYFYKVDNNFVRYGEEIWHFEYGTSKMGLKNRGRFTTKPPVCSKKDIYDVKASSLNCSLNEVSTSWGGKIIYVRAIVKGTAQGPVGARVELPILIWSDDKWDCGAWTYHPGALVTVGGTCTRESGQGETTNWSVETKGDSQGDFLKGKTRYYNAKVYKKGSHYFEKEAKTSAVCQ